jgi:pyruvate dehydrogenase E2 component (dihydrolipoamide acetyltransferase)
MPKLGLTMEEGTIIEWLVPDGTAVTAGDAVLVIETDKTETEVEASGTGVLRVVAAVGERLRCGEVIGHFLADGEELTTTTPPAATPATPAAPPTPMTPAVATATAPAPRADGGRLFASPNARRVAAELGVDLRSVRGTGPGGRITSEDVHDARAASPAAATSAGTTPTPSRPGIMVPATAAARQLADLLGVDLASVDPDPTEGRITRDSVAVFVRRQLASTATAAVAPSPLPPATQSPTATIPLRGMRGTIAKRMHASLTEMAQLTLTMDADMDAVVADRNERKAAGSAPGFTDYVIAATAKALAEHPRLNAQITDDGVALLPDIHIGMAVALDEGLIVPVIHDTTSLDLDTLAAETARLAIAARAGALTPDEVAGGTFSVTALGMFGVDAFTPVINPPNVAILGVGRLRPEITLIDGRVTSRQVLTLSLTWDHRALDGAPAAEFVQTICRHLRSP